MKLYYIFTVSALIYFCTINASDPNVDAMKYVMGK